ncbi:hypothetical protein CDL15_Pgr013243 [Punica granatum]|uniref:Uncharacterized protein n=1 Tax=Punica granatum TaxID=22663 RepID=A0A218WPD2_PUNGR|nr:hypothetical protein CDL15_Pgr013243 [Punica granatum]
MIRVCRTPLQGHISPCRDCPNEVGWRLSNRSRWRRRQHQQRQRRLRSRP